MTQPLEASVANTPTAVKVGVTALIVHAGIAGIRSYFTGEDYPFALLSTRTAAGTVMGTGALCLAKAAYDMARERFYQKFPDKF